MQHDRDGLRARLTEAGLDEHVDALIGFGAPAVRLRSVTTAQEHGFRVTPMVVDGLRSAAVAISSLRGAHFLAVLSDGSVAAWGENGRGQLGDGSRSDSEAAMIVRDVNGAVAVAGGGAHSLALLADGSVVGWGDNTHGQLCDGRRKYRAKAVPIPGLDQRVRAIAAGEENCFAVLDDGSVRGWGAIAAARVGAGAVPAAPIAMRGLDGGVVSLASGRSHTLAIIEDGSLRAWGGNVFGALGDGTTQYRDEPVLVRGLDRPVVAVAAADTHSVALMADGVVMAWGSNSNGALGHGSPTSRELEPVRVALDGEAVAIAAGGLSNHALLRDGSVVSWGANSHGQLGDGSIAARLTPVPVRAFGRGVRAITFAAALLDDGSIRRWGGPLPPGDDLDSAIPVGSSRLGGIPDLPAGASWPRRDGRPMALLAQIDLAEAAAYVESDEPLPRAGLLSLFVDHDALDEAGSWQLLFTPPGVGLARLPVPPDLADVDRIGAARLVFERETTWMPEYSAALEELGLPWPQVSVYAAAIDAEGDRPIHRMLGHPALVQPPDPRDAEPELCLLLQIDSDEAAGWTWGDAGCIYVWIRRDDLAAGRFDRAVLRAQSG